MLRKIVATIGLLASTSLFADILIPTTPSQQPQAAFECYKYTAQELGFTPSVNVVVNTNAVNACLTWETGAKWSYYQGMVVTPLTDVQSIMAQGMVMGAPISNTTLVSVVKGVQVCATFVGPKGGALRSEGGKTCPVNN